MKICPLYGRGYDCILKVTRITADMEEAACIEMQHVAEAINYRAFNSTGNCLGEIQRRRPQRSSECG
ncbi:MAG: hypothetical protein EOP09_13440 [Proteobacteria bacterium]|nr:MAG: hypothetical protein EOP09_13440 [Pseudomonadota bacterium]